MPASDPAEAVQQLVDRFTETLRCITPAPLAVSGYHVQPQPHVIAFRWPRPTVLPGRRRLSLVVRHHFRVVRSEPGVGWGTATAGYDYALRDDAGVEVIAYHWHPDGQSPVITPHLHLGTAAGATHPDLTPKAHLFTGIVLIEDVVQLAVEVFKVPARRLDWEVVLSQRRHSADTD